MSQIGGGSYKAAVTVGEILKPRIGSRELSVQSDQNTSQENVLLRKFSAFYPGLEEKTYRLTYCQKFPNLTT